MKSTPLLFLLTSLVAHSADRPTASPHRKGPHGLSGWTLNYEIPGQGRLPMKLVLARNGRIIRRVSGDFFVWTWMFLPNGKQVAFESGPMHFSMQCVLMDINSGNREEEYDCFKEPLRPDAPTWVKALEARASAPSGP